MIIQTKAANSYFNKIVTEPSYRCLRQIVNIYWHVSVVNGLFFTLFQSYESEPQNSKDHLGFSK